MAFNFGFNKLFNPNEWAKFIGMLDGVFKSISDDPTKARAWIAFNGTNGSALAQHGCSATVNGTGDYTVTFSPAMPSSSYSVVGVVQSQGIFNVMVFDGSAPSSATSYSFRALGSDGALRDSPYISVAFYSN